jgi:ElaB/YqjD/DUF883 family membrane-anchored ribosome-binding protein
VDNQVTGRRPEDKAPEEIEREMEQTRESLTQKVAALEQTVSGNIQAVTDTVEQVKTAVQDTVCTVKDTLRESVHTVADTVKETLDVSGHVRANPWLSVGVAAGCGFLTGLLLGGSRHRSLGATDEMPEEQARGHVPGSAPPPPSYAAQPREPEKPGFFDEVFRRVSREFREMAQSALDSALAALKRNVGEAVPKLVDTAVAEVVPGGNGAGYAARG